MWAKRIEYHIDWRSVNVLIRNSFEKIGFCCFIFDLRELKLLKPVWKFQTKHSILFSVTGNNSTRPRAVPPLQRVEKIQWGKNVIASWRRVNISFFFFFFFFSALMFFFLTRATDLAEKERLLLIYNSTYWNSPWVVIQSRNSKCTSSI